MTSKVTGAQATIAKLVKLQSAARLVASDEDLQNFLLRRVRSRFDAGVDVSGRPWPKLQPSTIARKRRAGYAKPDKALYASGRLRQALAIIRGTNAGLLAGNTGLGFRVGVSDPQASEYGKLHNYGIGVAQRQFIGVGPSDVVAIRGLINRRMKSIAKGL